MSLIDPRNGIPHSIEHCSDLRFVKIESMVMSVLARSILCFHRREELIEHQIEVVFRTVEHPLSKPAFASSVFLDLLVPCAEIVEHLVELILESPFGTVKCPVPLVIGLIEVFLQFVER